MLEHLRRRVETALAATNQVTLSTCGPADIQSSMVECTARGMRLYLRVPQSSDHLFNLEHHSAVVVTCKQWQVNGCARVMEASEDLSSILAEEDGVRRWSELVEVTPARIQVYRSGDTPGETIDTSEG